MAYPTAFPAGPGGSPSQVFIAIHLVLSKQRMMTHFDMDLNPCVPISSLKEELGRQLGVTPSLQEWFFRNNLLSEEYSLEQCGVINDSIVEVRPKELSSGTETALPSSSSSSSTRASHTTVSPVGMASVESSREV